MYIEEASSSTESETQHEDSIEKPKALESSVNSGTSEKKVEDKDK